MIDLEALGLDGVVNTATGAVVPITGEIEGGCLDTAGNTLEILDSEGVVITHGAINTHELVVVTIASK